MNGLDDSLCFSIMVCIRRAILSAPPPLPAMMTKSTCFFGSQAPASWGAATRPTLISKPPKSAYVIDFKGVFIVTPPFLMLIRGIITSCIPHTLMQAKPAVQGQHAIDSQRRLLSFAASRRPKRGVPTRLPCQEHLVPARLLEYRTKHIVPTKRRVPV